MITQLNIILSKYNNGITKKLSLEDLAILFKNDFSTSFEYFNNNVRFYRLDNISNEYVYYIPEERTSRIDSRLFALSLISPFWKNYPRRDHSICFQNSKTGFAHKFGKKSRYVFPKNDALLGISNGCDFNNIKYKSVVNCDMFNVIIDLINFISYYCDEYIVDENNAQAIIQWASRCEASIKNNKAFSKYDPDILTDEYKAREVYTNTREKLFSDKYDENIKYNRRLYQFTKNILILSKNARINIVDLINDIKEIGVLNTLFKHSSPEMSRLLVTAVKLVNYENSYYNGSEIWTESPCVLLDSKIFDAVQYKKLRDLMN